MYQRGIFAGEVGHIFAWANTERRGEFKNLPKNLVIAKSKLDNGRLHRKGSFNLK